MTAQRIATIFGVVFVLVAILGFVTSGMSMEADSETAPKLLGLFPVNAAHNGVHLAFGIWGLLAARSFAGAKNYLMVGGGIYLVLAVMGFIVPDTFGLIPIGGNDIWLHALLAAGMLAAALTARAPASATV